jgi:FlaG protein
MLVDPIRSSEPLQAQPAARVRANNASPQTSDNSGAPVPIMKPLIPPPDTSDDVKVQWEQDNGVILQFTDRTSGEVVRQIPSEQVLSVARFIRQLLQEQDGPASLNGERSR